MNLSDGKCCICKLHRETLLHLFWECDFSLQIWTLIEQKLHSIKNFNFDTSKFKQIVLLGSFDGFDKIDQSKLINTVIF